MTGDLATLTRAAATNSASRPGVGRLAAIVIGAVLVLAALAVAVAFPKVLDGTGASSSRQVSVSGNVRTIMTASVPVRVVFTDEHGTNTTTTVMGGSYAVSLAGGGAYAVNLYYLPTPGGNVTSCNAGSFNLDTGSRDFGFDVFC